MKWNINKVYMKRNKRKKYDIFEMKWSMYEVYMKGDKKKEWEL